MGTVVGVGALLVPQGHEPVVVAGDQAMPAPPHTDPGP